ncbi:MAG: hypothetical protein ABI346_09615 [Candidatus Baltobacteraceae bacterium]
MNKPAVRNVLSALLFAVAAAGFYVELRSARSGVPGQHHLVLGAYALIALYAAVSVIARLRSGTR